VLDAVKQRKRTTHVLLSEATVVSVDGTTLVLTHAVAPLVRRLSEDQNVAVVQEALTEVLGVNWRIRFEGGGQTTTARTSAAAQAAGRPVSAAASGSPASTPVTATVDDGGWPTVRAVPPPTSPALSGPAPVASPAASGPPAEEPPPEDEPDWDPDEDDDGDGSRVSVEDGAIALLAEQLGARKISEN
jgi:DNA polymerase-3 subunit gamma/tau